MGQYSRAYGFEEALKIRRPATNDMAIRMGVISPDRIILHNYPIGNPISAFNAGAVYLQEIDALKLYVRIILGYYMYVSYIAELTVPLDDVFDGYINTNRYTGDIVIYPSTKYDVWGTEDPRVYELDGQLFMTYTGRSINYFNPRVYKNRTLPVTAVYNKELKTWVKKYVFVLSEEKFPETISNKDAFLHKTGNGEFYLFHRPHFSDDEFFLFISKIDKDELTHDGAGIKEVKIESAIEVLEPSPFESKLGWASPPINIDKDRAIVFVHAVDSDLVVYRVFALLLRLSKEEVVIEAVTPRYIMEPRHPYELVGDRPLTIFPCGSVKIDENTIVMTYGAGDFMVGIALISLNEVLSELDNGRIY
ncbi:glycosidase [Desulfurococcaceae archaeon MEX13E-LK6-19]|nr:glycosidase [Desulfurococcaceae archaeon MEX13E-LK6-19]